jgi:hypothetical protein
MRVTCLGTAAEARNVFPATVVARDGMVLALVPTPAG